MPRNLTTKPRLVAPVLKLQSAIDKGLYDGSEVDGDSLRFLGCFVWREAISGPVLAELRAEMANPACQLAPQELHPTRVNIKNFETILKLLLKEKKVREVLESGIFFDGNIAVDPPVIFRKDKLNTARVILHNDIDYTAGSALKYSLFFAITTMKPENGGLQLYPGTHNFGSLGDAGEINPDVLPLGYPKLSPVLNPGDVLIMNSGTWHYSDASKENSVRTLIELKLLDAADPVASRVICGTDNGEWKNTLESEDLFISSRSSKLRALYERLASDERGSSSD